ncbi:MAG TPA: tannase/feruloyl esterase family alpha/beta hydrolase [Candidatus Dormibacteraeota bacterium]|nr:tannase/feruloyl esterase family alpha/beta hydrolase [Candidatus Dormibacteraeota bacterium]
MKCSSLRFFPILFVSLAVWAQGHQSFEPDQKACVALARAGGPVDSAEFVRPPFTAFAGGTAAGGTAVPPITVNVPFCRVVGALRPTNDSDIRFELWLPPQADWNSKFQGVGSGDSRGTIEYRALMRGLVRGYATVSTDSGHRSTGGVIWAFNRPERIIDFGYRAQHLATQAAKTLTQRFYGRALRYSYFVGCSQGGHHGMTEAQRFPEDYDGIIAGAPVYSWTDEMVDQAWNARALQQIPSHALSKDKLPLLAKSVIKACAGPDGLINDPRKCSFDPASLLCKDANDHQCLTSAEVEAVHQMYAGPKKSDGVQLSPGLSRGGESDWDWLWSNPERLGGSWQGVFRYMVFDDEAWDLPKMNFDRDPELARKKLGNTLNPDNPDLSQFAKHGGKMIVYHGWADDMVPSEGSVNYFDSVLKFLGTTRTKDFYRLFMIPGMAHCGRGPGANVLFQSELARNIPLEPKRDMLTALEHWVEKGEAPEAFVVSRVEEDGQVPRMRLVCPYPSAATYNGTGDPAQAQNWACSK